MSWNDVHKLKPQKPKPESKQDLNISTEFLVWGMQFNLNYPSDQQHPSTPSQDTLIGDAWS